MLPLAGQPIFLGPACQLIFSLRPHQCNGNALTDTDADGGERALSAYSRRFEFCRPCSARTRRLSDRPTGWQGRYPTRSARRRRKCLPRSPDASGQRTSRHQLQFDLAGKVKVGEDLGGARRRPQASSHDDHPVFDAGDRQCTIGQVLVHSALSSWMGTVRRPPYPITPARSHKPSSRRPSSPERTSPHAEY